MTHSFIQQIGKAFHLAARLFRIDIDVVCLKKNFTKGHLHAQILKIKYMFWKSG